MAAQRKTKQKVSDTDAVIGSNLKLIRKAQKMSQSALADQLGMTFQQVQKYESGKNRISASTLLQIAKILGVSVVDLLPIQDGNTSFFDDITKDQWELVMIARQLSDRKLADLTAFLKELVNYEQEQP